MWPPGDPYCSNLGGPIVRMHPSSNSIMYIVLRDFHDNITDTLHTWTWSLGLVKLQQWGGSAQWQRHLRLHACLFGEANVRALPHNNSRWQHWAIGAMQCYALTDWPIRLWVVFNSSCLPYGSWWQHIEKLSLDQSKLRTHLARCFERKTLSRFPKAKQQVPRSELGNVCILAYCKCRRPDSWNDMVLCDGCEQWIHQKCARLRRAPIQNWYCTDCKR